MRVQLVWVVSLFAGLIACGDDGGGGGGGKECGPGTTDIDGVCTADPDAPPVMCTDGTIADPTTGDCVLDPNACQDGTVKVGGACVDAGIVTTDITEAVEPNGLGLSGEDSVAPAGVITLKPIGQHFVLKGKIAPFQDLDEDGQLDADIDAYRVVVSGPTMLNVVADGLHGLAAGFVSVAAEDDSGPLASWTRFGISLTGDTSARQLFLPAAGTYVIAIADSRSLFFTSGAVGPASGAPDLEYYVTVDIQSFTPAALTLDADGLAHSTGQLAPGETKVFSVPMGLGVNTLTYDVDASQAVASVVVTNTAGATTKVRAVADSDEPDPATARAVGFRTGDTQLVIADTVFNYAQQNVDYDLTIQTGDAIALSNAGQSVSQPSNGDDFSVFFYDVANDDELTGLDLTWNVPVAGAVFDENLDVFANFTRDQDYGFFFEDTFSSYRGLLRHRTAGRYYFMVFDPATVPASTITATSTYAPVASTAITAGVPVTQTVNQFGSNAFTYSATSDWEAFKASAASGTTGVITGTYFPRDAYGRLDPLVSTCTSGGTDFCADAVPVFTHTYAEAGTTVGRIVLDDATKDYLVTMRPTVISTLPQLAVDLRPRDFINLGTLAAGTPVNRVGEILSNTTTVQRYLLKTGAGNGLAVTLTPNANLNTRFQQLNRDESNRGAAINNGAQGAPDLAQLFQAAEGWTAFTVTPVSALAAQQTFDLTALASAAVTYTTTTGSTAFSDACVGGTTLAMQDGDEGFSTATVTPPSGFDFFGFSGTAFKVNTNGFLTFDPAAVCGSVGGSCYFSNGAIPASASPNAIIAPYWDDLITTVCQKTVGTKLIIQWTGTTFTGSLSVQFQAILDGATDTIELVYSGTQGVTGQSATVGIENQNGSAGQLIGANVADTITPGGSILLTPM